MVAAARHDAILRELELRGSLSNAAFAARVGVSMMTLRRDLIELEARGLLHRVHGGAVSPAVDVQQRRSSGERSRTAPVATIGMIVPTAAYYFPEVIRGASEAARELNCRLVVGTSNYSAAEELRQAARLIADGVDALLITPHDTVRPASPLRELIDQASVPVFLIERAVDEPHAGSLEWVRSDHAAGAETAVRHLRDLGHTRIALAARPSATSAELRRGFERAMTGTDDHGLWWALSTPPAGATVLPDEIDGLLNACVAQQITAAIVLGDADAMTFTDHAITRGLRIPDDLAIVAYDDEISAHAAVPLTAVAPPKRELGHTALRLCFDRLRQPVGAPRTIVRMILLPNLVVRESTAPLEIA